MNTQRLQLFSTIVPYINAIQKGLFNLPWSKNYCLLSAMLSTDHFVLQRIITLGKLRQYNKINRELINLFHFIVCVYMCVLK